METLTAKIMIIGILLIVDVIGYVIKSISDKSFSEFKLNKIPFIWVFWG